MKKYLAIPLMLLYMISVSGTMIQIHFCGRDIESWTINNPSKASCDEVVSCDANLATIAKKSCCKDKTLTLKITQDQIASAFQFLFSGLQTAFLSTAHVIPVNHFKSAETENVYQANAPPGRWQNIPLFKLHQRFTYYG
jgi:hypothetical protein